MKSKLLLLSAVALMIGLYSCKPSDTKNQSGTETMADSSQNSLDWEGTYTGVIPCADCSGINVRIDLSKNNTYKMTQTYQGKEDGTFNYDGKFIWSDDGNTITLEGTSNGDTDYYPEKIKVGEGTLILLDKDGKEITGDLSSTYILTKVDKNLVEKYWKLTELRGQSVTYKNDTDKEAFMTLKTEGNRVHGNFGCNTFNGTYELKSGNRISFSQMASTMMMCPNMEIEQQFNEVLQQVDNYNLNGDTLVLNKARMAPLARFEAVYMK